MNKKALLALLLAATLLLSSCSLVVKNEKVANNLPVIKVNGEVITRETVQENVDSYLNYMQMVYYYYYGYSIDITDADLVSEARDTIIDELVEEKVVEQKKAEMQVATTTDLTDDLFKAEIVKDVTVTDEELQTYIDEQAAAAKETYASDADAFATAMNNGETVYYRPAGYRQVKNILIKYSDAYNTSISSLNSKVTAQETAMSTAKSELSEGADLDALLLCVNVTVSGSDATVTDLSDAYVVPEYTATSETTFAETEDEIQQADNAAAVEYAEARALRDAYAAQLDALKAAALASIDEKADAVLARLDAGEDFSTVMAEVTEDPGMQEGATNAATGYTICAGFSSFDSAFVDAGMALANVGDHTGKVAGTTYGYYILQYAAEIPEGNVPLSELYDTVYAEQLESKQDDTYDEQVQAWVDASDVVIDKTLLDK